MTLIFYPSSVSVILMGLLKTWENFWAIHNYIAPEVLTFQGSTADSIHSCPYPIPPLSLLSNKFVQ